MGVFLVNFHVHTDDVASIDALLADLDGGSRRSDPEAGWVSVYEERASQQDPEWIAELAAELSTATGAPTVAFLVHDSDAMQCWFAAEGAVQSHLDSWPGFPDDEPKPALDRPDALLAHTGDLDLAGLQVLFARDVVFAEDLVTAIATHLGIASGRALGDYRYDDEHATDGLADLKTLLEGQVPPAAKAASGPEAELVDAAHRGDAEAVTALLDGGVAIEANAPWRPESARSGPAAGMYPEIAATPLFAAASENRSEVVRVLIARGADPDGRIPQGTGPLAAAACAGHLSTVEALLEGGANPSATDAVGMTAATALAVALQQLDTLRGTMGDLAAIMPLPIALPDDADLEACAQALRAATER